MSLGFEGRALRGLRIGPENYTPEWYALRVVQPQRDPLCVIGASEIAAICGEDKYCSAFELYLRKQGLLPEKEQTVAMRMGRRLEAPILDEYSELIGLPVERPNCMVLSSSHPYLGASPDGMVVEDGNTRAVDAKCSTWRMAGNLSHQWGEDGTDQVPTQYLLQAHAQMYCCETDRCDLVVLLDTRTLRVYPIMRDETIIKSMLGMAEDFYRRLVEYDPPSPQSATDLAAVKTMYHTVQEGTSVTFDEETNGAYEAYCNVKHEIKQLEATRDVHLAKVLAVMGEHQRAELADGRTLRRVQVRESLWTEKDIEKLTPGSVRRAGYTRLMEEKNG